MQQQEKTNQGFAMLDILAAVTIFALLLPGIVTFIQMTSQSTNKKVAATQMKRIGIAAEEYIKHNHTSIVSSSTGSSSVNISLSDLISGGYLSSGYNNKNPWSQQFSIYAFNPDSKDVHLIILTEGGRGSSGTEFANRVVPAAASMIGSQGGYVPTGEIPGESSDTLQGAYGGWSFDMSGTDISIPDPGHLAYSKYIDQEQFGNDYLYRDEVPGHPELNRMTTELDMDGNTIEMGDGDVGGGNNEGVRKINFENHEADHFSCSDHDDDGGSVFYDRNEGLFVCRHGEKAKISDSLNSIPMQGTYIKANGDNVPKPRCGDGASGSPNIYVAPVYFSDNDSWRNIKAVQSWAEGSGPWTVHLEVLTHDGWETPSPAYGKLFVMTECS